MNTPSRNRRLRSALAAGSALAVGLASGLAGPDLLAGAAHAAGVAVPWTSNADPFDARSSNAETVRIESVGENAQAADPVAEGRRLKEADLRAKAAAGDYGQRSLDAAKSAKAEAEASAAASAKTPEASASATPSQEASPSAETSPRANAAETAPAAQQSGAATASVTAPLPGAGVPAGMAIVGVRGTFITESAGQNLDTAIAHINEIRLDAYNSGLVDRYVPISRSAALERTSQIRAVEATIYPGHTRPNGQGSASIGADGFASAGLENIAWGGRTLHAAIDQWAAEKRNYANELAGNPTGVSGHYRVMVDPSNTHVGLAMFVHSARYGTTIVGRFAQEDPAGPTGNASGPVLQGVYVPASVAKEGEFELSSTDIGPKAVFEAKNTVVGPAR